MHIASKNGLRLAVIVSITLGMAASMAAEGESHVVL
jgi:hypothetical protein